MFYPMFGDIVAEPDRCSGLDAMPWLLKRVLIALDGAEFRCSVNTMPALRTHTSGQNGICCQFGMPLDKPDGKVPKACG